MSQATSQTKALEHVLTTTGQSHIDSLYHTVLVQGHTSEDHLALIRSFLGFVVVAKRPLSLPSLCAILDIDNEDATWARDRLASVLLTDADSRIHAIHPSLIDFLTDRKRSDQFFINVEEHNRSLVRGILQTLNGQLRVNICRLIDQTVLNHEISDLSSHLHRHVSEGLAYSCQFWSDHLEGTSNQDPELLPLLHEFCDQHILHWLEVMSLKAETRNAIMAVQNIQRWLPVRIDIVDMSVDVTMYSCPRYVA
jgi:hypothetical protein